MTSVPVESAGSSVAPPDAAQTAAPLSQILILGILQMNWSQIVFEPSVDVHRKVQQDLQPSPFSSTFIHQQQGPC